MTAIVADGLSFNKAKTAIKRQAGELPKADQAAFVETVETECCHFTRAIWHVADFGHLYLKSGKKECKKLTTNAVVLN